MGFLYQALARLSVAFCTLMSSLIFSAQAADESPPQFKIDGTAVHTIASSVLQRSYDLYVKLPPGYFSKEFAQHRYPVLYINDAGYCWVTAVGITRPTFNFGAFERAILVGLSYAKGEGGTSSRTRDLTPTSVDRWELETGGARKYLNFIKTEVIPFVDRTYRTEPNRRTLVGQSFGGLFGAYALIEEPGLFQDYILTSASFWFDNQVIFELEEKARDSRRNLTGRVYFAVGETETPTIVASSSQMVEQQRAFVERLQLRNYEGLEVRADEIEGGTHLTTFPTGFTRAMRWLMPGPDIYNGGSR